MKAPPKLKNNFLCENRTSFIKFAFFPLKIAYCFCENRIRFVKVDFISVGNRFFFSVKIGRFFSLYYCYINDVLIVSFSCCGLFLYDYKNFKYEKQGVEQHTLILSEEARNLRATLRYNPFFSVVDA